MLAGGLALTDDQRAELFAAARPELLYGPDQAHRQFVDSPPDDHVAAHRLALAATPLIGREREVADLVARIVDDGSRLITLTGPGGVGKTRLALEVAANTRVRSGHHVIFIPLATIIDPGLVAPIIGRSFGLSNSHVDALPERLSIALADQQQVLVLDNFERLLSAAPLIANLLLSCPSLKVLVTSRVVLRLSAEHEFAVSPLELPQRNATSE